MHRFSEKTKRALNKIFYIHSRAVQSMIDGHIASLSFVSLDQFHENGRSDAVQQLSNQWCNVSHINEPFSFFPEIQYNQKSLYRTVHITKQSARFMPAEKRPNCHMKRFIESINVSGIGIQHFVKVFQCRPLNKRQPIFLRLLRLLRTR